MRPPPWVLFSLFLECRNWVLDVGLNLDMSGLLFSRPSRSFADGLELELYYLWRSGCRDGLSKYSVFTRSE
jgi:hypothetical protein